MLQCIILGFITEHTTSGMEALVGAMLCMLFEENAMNRSSSAGKTKFKVVFDLWLMSTKKERLDTVQSDFNLNYFGESQVILIYPYCLRL